MYGQDFPSCRLELSPLILTLKEAQRAAKGKPPSGQKPGTEQTGSKEGLKDPGSNEPTKSKAELRAERRAKQVSNVLFPILPSPEAGCFFLSSHFCDVITFVT